MGPRSDFSKPCQGAAEKSANATRCCCLARGFQRVGMSTVEAVNRKISWLFCFVSHGCAVAERVEEEFGVEIPDEKAEKIRTVADAVKLLDEEK